MEKLENIEDKDKEIENINIILCPECDGRGYNNKGKCELCKGKGEFKI